MPTLVFAPASVKVDTVTFTFTKGVAAVISVNAAGVLPRIRSKTTFGISIRAKSSLPRIKSKTTFGASIRAVGTLPKIKSKVTFGLSIKASGKFLKIQSVASLGRVVFTPKTISFLAAKTNVSSPLFSFTKPPIAALIATGVFPRLRSRVRLGPPMNITGASNLPRIRSKADVFVPFALRATSTFPHLKSFTRILIPPLEIGGASNLPRITSNVQVFVPYVVKAKASFRLFSRATMTVSVDAISDGYFGGLQVQGHLELGDAPIHGRRRRLSTSVN